MAALLMLRTDGAVYGGPPVSTAAAAASQSGRGRNQRDSNGDGNGNRCDPDPDDDGFVDFADAALLNAVLFSSDENADLDGDGYVATTISA